LLSVLYRGDHFRFGSVFIKKSNQTESFFKKTETDSRPVSVWFDLIFYDKTGSNWFGSVFSVWLDFFGLARFFPVWLGFFQFFSVWIRFGSVFLVLGL